ncbi:MAG TPA: hypothetical protein VIL11_03830 [Limnochordales bacterium]
MRRQRLQAAVRAAACLLVVMGLAGAGPGARAGVVAGQAPGSAGGFLRGPVGFAGFAAYHLVRVERFNDAIRAYNTSQSGPDLPLLPSSGFAAGFGVFVPLNARLAFASAGSELNVERRQSDSFVRLRVNDTQVGLYYLVREQPRLRVLLGGLVGLAAVELEWGVRTASSCSSIVDKCLQGARWSRLTLSLQPEVGLQVALTPTAGLLFSLGYLVTTDFWNPRWAHGIGDTLPDRSEVVAGAVWKATLIVGGL